MAIPKVIHYCWFGGADLPEDVKKCIASWEKHCPDYKIIRWDESNYDYAAYQYAKGAYEHKKWAFVSDVARLDIIYREGGIYLDTDVELIKSLDFLIDESAFMAFEQGRKVATGLGFGAEKGNKLIKRNLDIYSSMEFVNKDGSPNMIACPIITTRVLKEYGLIEKDREQIIEGLKVFPSSYFCPMIFSDGRAEVKKETVSIHHYAGTWTTKEEKLAAERRRKIYTVWGRKGLRVYDGIVLLKRRGWKAFAKRCWEIVLSK